MADGIEDRIMEDYLTGRNRRGNDPFRFEKDDETGSSIVSEISRTPKKKKKPLRGNTSR